jgi:hypothetical protein
MTAKKNTPTTDENNAAFTAHAAKNDVKNTAGRNALPVEDMGNPAMVERTVENSFPFELEFGNNSILIKTVSDDGHTVPFLVGAKVPGQVHGILNATYAIWADTYPVFDPGYMYLHRSFEDARLKLGDNNVGYVLGGSRLVSDIANGVFACPPKPIKAGVWYRIHWDMPRFSLWEVVERDYVEGEPEWCGHDRSAIRILNGLELIYKAVSLGQSIRCHVFSQIAWMYQEKVDQYNLVLQGKITELKERVGKGIAKKAQTNHYRMLAANPEKVERSNQRYGTEVLIRGNGRVDANELLGKKVMYYRGNVPVSGEYLISEANVSIMVAHVNGMNYTVEIVD